jgi:hypothetical protein
MMKPNGVIHTHAIKLMTLAPGKSCPEGEMIFLPDWQYHKIRNYLKQFPELGLV